MNNPQKTRHRGTWSTLAIVFVFALSVCTLVYGIFNLATSVPIGLSAIALSISFILPGFWWLRWYQKPRMIRGLMPVSISLFIPGVIGLAISASDEVAPFKNPQPVVSQTSSHVPLVSSEIPTSSPPSYSSSNTVPPSNSTEPSTSISSTFEIPTTAEYQTPTPTFVPPIVTPTRTPETQHSITESLAPEEKNPIDVPTETSEESTEPLVSDTETTEQPAEPFTDPFQEFLNQFVR